MKKLSRYILCRPHGGLNDTLCQIELCWCYAEKFKRELIIDANQSSLFGHFDDFFSIVNPSITVHTRITPALSDKLNQITCNPSILQGKLGYYDSEYHDHHGYIEKTTKAVTRFGSSHADPFSIDFPEELLVYENCGGGSAGIEMLKKISLIENIQTLIADSISALPPVYIAVHVRNTDYKTDYEKLFAKIKKVKEKDELVLVCSDDVSVIEEAKNIFPDQVISFNRRPRSNHPVGVLHSDISYADQVSRSEAVIESLTDLIGLAFAQRLYLSNVNTILDSRVFNETGEIVFRKLAWTISGFSQLARFLCLNKMVLKKFCGEVAKSRFISGDPNVMIFDQMPFLYRVLRRVKGQIKFFVKNI